MVNSNGFEGVNSLKLISAIKGEESDENTPLNQKSTLGGSALGLYQVVDATRKDVYNKYFKENMSKVDFDTLYLKDAQFQKTVASKVIDMYSSNAEEQNQKYNIPLEHASVLNYFLGPEGADAYLKFYNASGNNHEYAQEKYNEWHLKKHGTVNKNTNVKDYVRKTMNRYYN